MIDSAAPELVAQAKRFAALSAVYDPVDALPEPVRRDAAQASLVASELAMASDTNPNDGSGWLLRSAERRYILAMLQSTEQLATAVAERRSGPLAPETIDLLDALDGRGLFAADSLSATIADPAVSSETIVRIVTALDRADVAAPGAANLTPARIRLAELTEATRRLIIAARGFFGRDDERATLAAWLDAPILAAPARAALLSGSPGIGKSALLDAITAEAVDRHEAVVVRLDFDRAGLDVLDLRGLTMEVARQLVERIGVGAEALLDVRLAAARVEDGSKRYEGSARASVPAELAAAIGRTVAAAGRPVLLVLDTLEVLRARGERQVGQLFAWIDRLVTDGMVPLSVLGAGRGDVFDTCPDRRGPWLPLEGLDRDAAAMLLDRLEVPATARASVLDLADGSPLVMRLAARVVKGYGTGRLPRGRLQGAVAAGFLYRFLLSRVIDPDLRRLAHPGLIVRRLSADVLRGVLAPQLGLKRLSEARAQALFDALAAEHWLVERDPVDPLFVRHRGDMRALLLPLLYSSRPGQCARVDAAAVRWFARRDDAESRVDAAYHSLQLMRSRPHPPMIDANVARRFDAATLDELPEAARAVVDRAAGGRTALFRGDTAAPAPADDADAANVLLHLIDTGDWIEGRYVVDQIERGGLDPRSVTAEAVRAFHWRAGRWADAWQLLAERDRLAGDDYDLGGLPPPLALVRMEMRAEFSPHDPIARLMASATAAPIPVGASPGDLARFGALGFVLAAHGLREAGQAGRDGDPVAAAFALWAGGDGGTAEFAFGVARDRLRARGLDSADARWNDPQLLQLLSPYAPVAANLLVRNDAGLAAASDTETRLAGAGGLMASTAMAVGGTNPIAGIAGLGLFAEWAGVAAMQAGDRDLRRIARSAERWRRVVAGDWRYGRPPRGWRQEGPVDRTLANRIAALQKDDAPRTAALAQLALWAADGDGARSWHDLRRRFATTFAHAAALDDPLARAARLRAMPAAFVPAAAILMASHMGDS